MTIDKNARYLESHEWARQEGNLFTIGISDHAQSQLSDIVYVELPEVDDEFEAEELFGVVESVKAASDVFMPLSGTVVEINEELLDAPELINGDAFGDGWMIKIAAADEAEGDDLMDAAEYAEFIK
ncbi:MAG: glycine cleavage system protein GcvH [Chloroflexota bacterium]|nr:glycine cleavage system protein GcvH [Chloroflexota bacterium]